MKPKISVVLGTYNQRDVLKLVLQSFNDQNCRPEDFEVVVVDSSSTDGTEQMVRAFPFSYYKIDNRGKTAARNHAIRQARADLILITDGDMIAHPDLVKEHILFHEETAKFTCPSGRRVRRFPNGAVAEGKTCNFKKKKDSLDDCLAPDNLVPYLTENPKPYKKLPFSNFLTGNLSIKKETIMKAGLFDEDFTGYGWEDIELGYRVTKMGVPILFLASAINYHYHFFEDIDMLKRKFDMGRSAQVFLKKHPDMEVKLYLGINPLAMAIYRFLKSTPNLFKVIEKKAKNSKFFEYVLEEYYYRAGLTGNRDVQSRVCDRYE